MSNDAHLRPRGESEQPLYDTEVPTPTHGERARTLADAIRTGTLCTLATDPVFFISELAEHTKNLRADSRASLLVAESGEGDPLAKGRVTLLGHGRVLSDRHERDVAQAAYLSAHPNAAYYIDYSDFAFWRLDVESVRYIGGYGRMSWVDVAAWRAGEPDPIASHASAIIDHMNADHADAMIDFCRALTRATDTTAATMTGVDRYGFEMSAQTGRGPRPIRLAFPAPIATPDDARRAMVALVRRARELLAAGEAGTSPQP
jgi:hypothetical protein